LDLHIVVYWFQENKSWLVGSWLSARCT